MVPCRFILVHPLRDVGAHLRWAVVAMVVAMHQAHRWWVLEQPRFWTYFQYRPQTSDFSIVYNLSLPAMWSGYVIVFRGCFRNRGCFRIAAVPMMASARQKPLVRPRHPTQTWHKTTQSTLWVRNFVDKYRHVPDQLEYSCRLKFRCTWVLEKFSTQCVYVYSCDSIKFSIRVLNLVPEHQVLDAIRSRYRAVLLPGWPNSRDNRIEDSSSARMPYSESCLFHFMKSRLFHFSRTMALRKIV